MLVFSKSKFEHQTHLQHLPQSRFLRFDLFNSSIPNHSSSEYNIKISIYIYNHTNNTTSTKNACLFCNNGFDREFGGAIPETGVVSRRAPQRHSSSSSRVVLDSTCKIKK